MSNRDVLIELVPYAKTVAKSKIKSENGELSVVDDAAQAGLLYALERTGETEQQTRYNIVRGIDYYLRKHRERGYKQQMWQSSANDLYSETLWGDNPDFE